MMNDITGLSIIAEEINREHAAFISGLAHAVKAGELLLQAKALVAHGGWSAWLANNVRFSERTARGYMRVAEHWPELEKTATVVDQVGRWERLYRRALLAGTHQTSVLQCGYAHTDTTAPRPLPASALRRVAAGLAGCHRPT